MPSAKPENAKWKLEIRYNDGELDSGWFTRRYYRDKIQAHAEMDRLNKFSEYKTRLVPWSP